MSLTGPVFLTAVVVCTVAAFVVVVVVWPSLAGPSPGKIAARAGMLLTVNVLVLLTAASQLNAQFLFFADWTDLRGAVGGTVTMTSLTRGANASAAAAKAVGGTAARPDGALRPLPAGAGTSGGVISYTIKGPMSGITGTVVVQLPPGYTKPSNASMRFPVLEAFGGYPASPRQMIDVMNLGGVMAQESAAKRMRTALIVSPQWEIPDGADSECVNGSPGYPQVETWLTRDIPNWVVRTFRVRTDRSSWATIGVSAGGWCAAMAAMLHPAQYGAGVALLGYFRPDFNHFYEPYPPGSPLGFRYDLVDLARRDPPPVALWLEASHADPISYPTSAALLKAARPPLAVNALILQNAGHARSVVKSALPQSLAWLGANVSGFTPTP